MKVGDMLTQIDEMLMSKLNVDEIDLEIADFMRRKSDHRL